MGTPETAMLCETLRPWLKGLEIEDYHARYVFYESRGRGIIYHYSVQYDGFTVDQFLPMEYVDVGDCHEDEDIYERLWQGHFHVTLGAHGGEMKGEFDMLSHRTEKGMMRHLRQIESTALMEDPRKIVSTVLLCRTRQEVEARQREVARLRRVARRRHARLEAEESGKRSGPVRKKRARRYSA